MRTAHPEGPSGGRLVTAVGLLTLLAGGLYAVVGGLLIAAGADADRRLEGDPAGGFGWLLQILAAFTAAVGVAALLVGVIGVVAGWGVLSRRPWARVLTLVVAALATVAGVGWVVGGEPDATDFAVGAGHFLYGTFALVVLARNGAEFARRRYG